MKVLVTGADGFVGGWMVPRLLQAGHQVAGALRPGGAPPARLGKSERDRIRWLTLELRDGASVSACLAEPCDAIVHLAAVASGSEARQDPGHAWEVNAAGTARLAEVLVR